MLHLSSGDGFFYICGKINGEAVRAAEHPLPVGSYCVDFCLFVLRTLHSYRGLRKPWQTAPKSPSLQQSSVGTANYHDKSTLAAGTATWHPRLLEIANGVEDFQTHYSIWHLIIVHFNLFIWKRSFASERVILIYLLYVSHMQSTKTGRSTEPFLSFVRADTCFWYLLGWPPVRVGQRVPRGRRL